ncbi:MAG: Colicin production protein [Chloroflexota bacterium]|nr:Colicin production protein [Chloroflexota bacterium]
MDIVHTITSIGPFDWLVLAFAVVMFVLGFAQGVIRRLLGIVSIAFSFLLAANLRDTLGSFFATYWLQFPREYSYMLAFGILFLVATLIFALVSQSFYKRAPIFAQYPVLDELLGGLLGVVQALLIIGCGIAILDSFYRLPVGIGETGIQPIRDVYTAVNDSATAAAFRSTIIPAFVAIAGPLVPGDLKALFPRN